MDKDIKDLHLQKAIKLKIWSFYITLATYGYILIGNGILDVFIADLMHEITIYRRLRNLQGLSIPVHLGNIDLVYPGYEVDVQVIHMRLIHYGGRNLTKNDVLL